MSQKRVVFILLASAIVGLLAVLAAFKLVNTSPAPVASVKPLHQVVIANNDLKPGELIKKSDLVLSEWHAAQPPVGASHTLESLIGQKPASPVKKGEVILDSHLRRAGPAPLSETIRPGYRAVTIQVNDASDVAGFVLPGSLVDVMMRVQDDGGNSLSRVIVQRVAVLAAGQERQVEDPSRPKSTGLITLEVTPGQAEQIDLARGLGVITLLLRNSSDLSLEASMGTSPQALEPALSMIEIIRGTERTREARE